MKKYAALTAVILTLACLLILIPNRGFFLSIYDTGPYAQEIKTLRQKLSASPNDHRIMTNLGELYILRHRYGEAEQLLTRSIKIDPEYPLSYYFLGKTFVLQKRSGEAAAAFHTFQNKMEPVPYGNTEVVDFYIDALHYISYVYFMAKDYDLAESVCAKITKLRPDDQKAHYNLAVAAYIHERNREKAYKELERVILIDKTSYLADKARFYEDYIRRNPDPRFAGDFTFATEKD